MQKKITIISYIVAIIMSGIFVLPSYAWLTFDSFPATERDELPQGPQDGEWVYSSQYANNTYINSTHGCQRPGYYDNPIYFNWFKYYHNSYNNSHMGFVKQGEEKVSDEVIFTIDPTKNYYVTFKIIEPSVYLNPPDTYTELYFTNEDHSSDIDWGDNGHRQTRDYHALSKILYVNILDDGNGEVMAFF